jgi:hypothetical protein
MVECLFRSGRIEARIGLRYTGDSVDLADRYAKELVPAAPGR